MLVIPAAREADAGESLEAGIAEGCSEPRFCHCIPAWVKERDSISKKKNQPYNSVVLNIFSIAQISPKSIFITSNDLLILTFSQGKIVGFPIFLVRD